MRNWECGIGNGMNSDFLLRPIPHSFVRYFSSSLSWSGVSSLDRRPDKLSTLFCCDFLLLLYAGCLICKFIIFDNFPEPAGIFTLAQMIEPGFIVYPFGQLKEDDEILRPKF